MRELGLFTWRRLEGNELLSSTNDVRLWRSGAQWQGEMKAINLTKK